VNPDQEIMIFPMKFKRKSIFPGKFPKNFDFSR